MSEQRLASGECSCRRRTLTHLPQVTSQGRANDCGPHALAMALSARGRRPVCPEIAGRALRSWRIPWIGATLPWGQGAAARRLGFSVRGGWFGRLEDIKRGIDNDRPVIVIVHPDDFGQCPWYALHYRVVVGYVDDTKLTGAGELYLACSATATAGLSAEHPGNVAMTYERFVSQWRTWLTINWWLEIT